MRQSHPKCKISGQALPALYAIHDSFSRKKVPLTVEMAYHDLESGEKVIQPVEFSFK